MPDQVCFDLIADQPDRSPRCQRFGRNTHRSLYKIDRGIASQCLIQSLTEADACRRCISYRGTDQFMAAKFQEGAVTESLPGSPFENARGIAFSNPVRDQFR